MGFANASAASRSSTGYAVMAGAMVLLLASGWMGAPGARQAAEAMPGRNLEFLHSAAGIDGRIQIIRRMEKAMLANAAVPRRATDYRHRRDQARNRAGGSTGWRRSPAAPTRALRRSTAFLLFNLKEKRDET
jgi:hypothetical protein